MWINLLQRYWQEIWTCTSGQACMRRYGSATCLIWLIKVSVGRWGLGKRLTTILLKCLWLFCLTGVKLWTRLFFISGRQQSYRKSLWKITGNFGKLSQKCVQEESAKWRARVLYVLGMLHEMACFKKLEWLAWFTKSRAWGASKNWPAS